MALSRFLSIFAVCAAVLIAGASAIASRWAEDDFDFGYRRNPRTEASRLTTALDVLKRRDSILSAIRRDPVANGLRVVVGADVDPALRTALDTSITSVWRQAVGTAPKLPTVILVGHAAKPDLPDMASPNENVLLLPREMEGRACVIVARLEHTQGPVGATYVTKKIKTVRNVLADQAGLCRFHAKYGLAGAGMTRWLDSVRYLPAMSMTADVRVDSVTARDLKTRLGHETTSSLSRYRYETPEPSFAGLKCLTGSDEYCSRGVATPRSFYYERFARSPLLPNGFLPLTGFAYDIDATINTHTLAKLEERLGPERFARVWTSPEPLDRAFPKEAGVSLTALLRDVLLERYGPVRSTPWPDPIEWAVLLGVIAAATGIMVFARRRRTLLA